MMRTDHFKASSDQLADPFFASFHYASGIANFALEIAKQNLKFRRSYISWTASG